MKKKLNQKFDLKYFSKSLFFFVSIIFLTIYLSSCDKKDETKKSSDANKQEIQKSSDSIKQKDSTTKQVVYTCPMHPEVRSMNKDDKCPKCGMKLEERKVK